MGDISSTSGYLLANEQPAAAARMAALSALFDPVSRRHIADLGITSGWRCWEVGAGGPAMAGWLAEQVGRSGYVLATDIDLSLMPAAPPFDMQRHDVGAQPPPQADFDLIHVRLVLVHVPDRDAALGRLVTALRPGGVLLVEEADPGLQPLLCLDEVDEAAALANRLKAGFRTLMASRGVDLAYGRTLPRRLRAAGLSDVRADAFFPVTAPECAVLERTTIEQVRRQLVDADLATEDEIARHLMHVDSGRLDLTVSPLVSAWGRRRDA